MTMRNSTHSFDPIGWVNTNARFAPRLICPITDLIWTTINLQLRIKSPICSSMWFSRGDISSSPSTVQWRWPNQTGRWTISNPFYCLLLISDNWFVLIRNSIADHAEIKVLRIWIVLLWSPIYVPRTCRLTAYRLNATIAARSTDIPYHPCCTWAEGGLWHGMAVWEIDTQRSPAQTDPLLVTDECCQIGDHIHWLTMVVQICCALL